MATLNVLKGLIGKEDLNLGTGTYTRLKSDGTSQTMTKVDMAQLGGMAVANVKDPAYGALGDDSSDDTTAIQAAIDAAESSVAANRLGIVFLPPGTYKITSRLNIVTGQIIFMGSGRNVTTIKQYTDNTGILKVDIGDIHVQDMSLSYSNRQNIANTSAIGLDLGSVAWSSFVRIHVNSACYGIKQSGTGFSNTFSDIVLKDFSKTASDISGSNSGCVMSNIYCKGDNAGVKNDTEAVCIFGSWTNGVINQLNIEDVKPTEGIYLNTCAGLTFNGIHFEQVELEHDFSSFFHADGGSHVVNTIDISFCTTGSGLALIGVIRAGIAQTKILCNALTGKSNSVGSTKFEPAMWASGAETGVEIWTNAIQDGIGFTTLRGTSSASVPLPHRDACQGHRVDFEV